MKLYYKDGIIIYDFVNDWTRRRRVYVYVMSKKEDTLLDVYASSLEDAIEKGIARFKELYGDKKIRYIQVNSFKDISFINFS